MAAKSRTTTFNTGKDGGEDMNKYNNNNDTNNKNNNNFIYPLIHFCKRKNELLPKLASFKLTKVKSTVNQSWTHAQ